MLRRERVRKGFTLIELLVVLVILALLAGIVLPRFMDRTKDANVSAAKTQISNFKNALNLYMLDNGQPPSTQQGLEALVTEPTSSPRPRNWKKYLGDVNEVPQDPWGNAYQYEAPGPNGEDYLITSLGADGRPGGAEYDADITSLDTRK
ncbi:MAG: type II secretion system major pseudopilin GspG [Armatimonadota bacterium]